MYAFLAFAIFCFIAVFLLTDYLCGSSSGRNETHKLEQEIYDLDKKLHTMSDTKVEYDPNMAAEIDILHTLHKLVRHPQAVKFFKSAIEDLERVSKKEDNQRHLEEIQGRIKTLHEQLAFVQRQKDLWLEDVIRKLGNDMTKVQQLLDDLYNRQKFYDLLLKMPQLSNQLEKLCALKELQWKLNALKAIRPAYRLVSHDEILSHLNELDNFNKWYVMKKDTSRIYEDVDDQMRKLKSWEGYLADTKSLTQLQEKFNRDKYLVAKLRLELNGFEEFKVEDLEGSENEFQGMNGIEVIRKLIQLSRQKRQMEIIRELQERAADLEIT